MNHLIDDEEYCFNEIDILYRLNPYDFNFLNIKNLFADYTILNTTIQFCLDNNYIKMNDPKFQKFIADSICNLNPYDPFRIDAKTETGLLSIPDLKVFYFCCRYILTEETIRTYLTENNETLFHQISKISENLNEEITNKMFIVFDNAKFDYTTPNSRSLLIEFLEKHNNHGIILLLQRVNVNLNNEKTFEAIQNYILCHITPLKHKIDTSSNPIYRKVYSSPNLLNSLFINKDDSVHNEDIIYYLTTTFGYNNYNLFKTKEERDKLVKPKDKLKYYYHMIQFLIMKGLNINKRFNGKTLLESYLEGCYPILLFEYDLHMDFYNILNYKV